MTSDAAFPGHAPARPADTSLDAGDIEALLERAERVLRRADGEPRFRPVTFVLRQRRGGYDEVRARLHSFCLQVEAVVLAEVLEWQLRDRTQSGSSPMSAQLSLWSEQLLPGVPAAAEAVSKAGVRVAQALRALAAVPARPSGTIVAAERAAADATVARLLADSLEVASGRQSVLQLHGGAGSCDTADVPALTPRQVRRAHAAFWQAHQLRQTWQSMQRTDASGSIDQQQLLLLSIWGTALDAYRWHLLQAILVPRLIRNAFQQTDWAQSPEVQWCRQAVALEAEWRIRLRDALRDTTEAYVTERLCVECVQQARWMATTTASSSSTVYRFLKALYEQCQRGVAHLLSLGDGLGSEWSDWLQQQLLPALFPELFYAVVCGLFGWPLELEARIGGVRNDSVATTTAPVDTSGETTTPVETSGGRRVDRFLRDVQQLWSERRATREPQRRQSLSARRHQRSLSRMRALRLGQSGESSADALLRRLGASARECAAALVPAAERRDPAAVSLELHQQVRAALSSIAEAAAPESAPGWAAALLAWLETRIHESSTTPSALT